MSNSSAKLSIHNPIFQEGDYCYYGSSHGDSFYATGTHAFNYYLDARKKSGVAGVVHLEYLTIKGSAAFDKAVKHFSDIAKDPTSEKSIPTRGCYILYNSFTKKLYVGKSEGANSESEGLLARFGNHRSKPKFEFDTIFCVYPSQTLNSDLNSIAVAFSGHFLTYMEALLYETIVDTLRGYFIAPEDFLINQPLKSVSPDNNKHLIGLVKDHVVPSLMAWATMTGLSLNPAISLISKSSSSGVPEKNETTSTPLLSASSSMQIPAGMSTPNSKNKSSVKFAFDKRPQITLKDPIKKMTTSVISTEKASEQFIEIVVHLINQASIQNQAIFTEISSQFKTWIKFEDTNTIEQYNNGSRDISNKIKKLPQNFKAYLGVNYSNLDKLRHLTNLVNFLVQKIPAYTPFSLEDFIE